MLIGAQVAGNVYNRFLGGAASLTLDRWPSFWVLPAGFAAVVLLLFAALFRPGGARAPARGGRLRRFASWHGNASRDARSSATWAPGSPSRSCPGTCWGAASRRR